MPTSGTFRLRITPGVPVLTGPAAWFYNGPADPQVAVEVQGDGKDIYAASDGFGGADGTYTYRAYCDSGHIILDSDPPIAFGSIPAGFKVNTAVGLAYLSKGDPGASDRATFQWYFANFPVGAPFHLGNGTISNFVQVTLPLDIGGNPPDMIALLGVGFGFNIVGSWGVGQFGYAGIDFLEIQGTYVIQGFPVPTVPVPTPTILNSNVPVRVGDKVLIDTDGLTDITEIQLDYGSHTIILSKDPQGFYIDGVFWYWVDFVYSWIDQVAFYVPWGIRNFIGVMTVTIRGTSFSGSVVAGTLNIIFTDASGIYFLDKAQTSDILYFRGGNVSILNQIMLDFNTDEIAEDDFYSLLGFPQAIMAQNNLNEEIEPEESYFSETAALQVVYVPTSVEIPSPFIKTGFIP